MGSMSGKSLSSPKPLKIVPLPSKAVRRTKIISLCDSDDDDDDDHDSSSQRRAVPKQAMPPSKPLQNQKVLTNRDNPICIESSDSESDCEVIVVVPPPVTTDKVTSNIGLAVRSDVEKKEQDDTKYKMEKIKTVAEEPVFPTYAKIPPKDNDENSSDDELAVKRQRLKKRTAAKSVLSYTYLPVNELRRGDNELDERKPPAKRKQSDLKEGTPDETQQQRGIPHSQRLAKFVSKSSPALTNRTHHSSDEECKKPKPQLSSVKNKKHSTKEKDSGPTLAKTKPPRLFGLKWNLVDSSDRESSDASLMALKGPFMARAANLKVPSSLLTLNRQKGSDDESSVSREEDAPNDTNSPLDTELVDIRVTEQKGKASVLANCYRIAEESDSSDDERSLAKARSFASETSSPEKPTVLKVSATPRSHEVMESKSIQQEPARKTSDERTQSSSSMPVTKNLSPNPEVSINDKMMSETDMEPLGRIHNSIRSMATKPTFSPKKQWSSDSQVGRVNRKPPSPRPSQLSVQLHDLNSTETMVPESQIRHVVPDDNASPSEESPPVKPTQESAPVRRRSRAVVNYKVPGENLDLDYNQLYLTSPKKPDKRERKPSATELKTNRHETRKMNDAVADTRIIRSSSRKTMADEVKPVSESRPTKDRLVPTDQYCMDAIDHLSHVHIDPATGCPTQYFSVLRGSDETIYDFKVTVRPSGIPNSGLGAFMTFLGARVLKPECHRRSQAKLALREAWVPKTLRPLVAQSINGFGVNLKLTGANLHGNQNSTYWVQTKFPMTAILPRERKVTLTLTGDYLHGDDSDDDEEPLNLSVCPKRIGFLGIHIASDYVADPSIQFSSSDEGCGYIDIGRYGPVLTGDRKCKLHFDIKSFIFSHEPSGWCFDVKEDLHLYEQLVDITDDTTGEPHKVARSRIQIHVNEVGHNKKLKQNVLALEKDERAVHYYVDIKTPLPQGETVELLTDYYDVYEPVRERKGYGKARTQSDDHEPTALSRNFKERYEIQGVVGTLSIWELFHTLEFVATCILAPIVQLTDPFIVNSHHEGNAAAFTDVTCLQWIARRRMHWLSGHFKKQVEKLLNAKSEWKTQGYPYGQLLAQSRRWAKEMEWTSFPQFFLKWTDSFDATGMKEVYEAMDAELREEMLYQVSDKLVMPLEETLWCPLAADFMKTLCHVTTMAQASFNDKETMRVRLNDAYLCSSRKAALDVRLACDAVKAGSPAGSRLLFDSGVANDDRIKVHWESSTFTGNSNAKGDTSSLVDYMAYRDAMELGMMPRQDGVERLKKATRMLCMTKQSVAFPTAGLVEGWCNLFSVPRDLNWILSHGATANATWYIVWQVIFVAHAFATEFLLERSKSPRSSDAVYSLFQLCHVTGVDERIARKAIATGIAVNHRKRKRQAPVGDGHKTKVVKSKLPKSSSADRKSDGGGPNHNKFLFDSIVWKALVDLGWSRQIGTRPSDSYFMPPGVIRGVGYSNRKHYFDSVKLVMHHIETSDEWKNKAEVLDCLDLFKKCTSLLARLRLQRAVPKGPLDVDWLVGRVNDK